MSWTYEESALDNEIYQVKLKLGDTNPNDQQLQDEEVELLLAQSDSVNGAALAGARLLAARYARSVDKWVGDLKILASQRHRAYLELAKSLSSSALVRGVPSAGGIHVSDKESITENEDLVSPYFVRDQHTNTETR